MLGFFILLIILFAVKDLLIWSLGAMMIFDIPVVVVCGIQLIRVLTILATVGLIILFTWIYKGVAALEKEKKKK